METFFETIGVMCCFGVCFFSGIGVALVFGAAHGVNRYTRQYHVNPRNRRDLIEIVEQVFF